jgi:hypothetical protein
MQHTLLWPQYDNIRCLMRLLTGMLGCIQVIDPGVDIPTNQVPSNSLSTLPLISLYTPLCVGRFFIFDVNILVGHWNSLVLTRGYRIYRNDWLDSCKLVVVDLLDCWYSCHSLTIKRKFVLYMGCEYRCTLKFCHLSLWHKDTWFIWFEYFKSWNFTCA